MNAKSLSVKQMETILKKITPPQHRCKQRAKLNGLDMGNGVFQNGIGEHAEVFQNRTTVLQVISPLDVWLNDVLPATGK